MYRQIENQDILTPNKPRRKWKRWLLSLFLIAMIPVQYLNHTGFCYSEMRYLTGRELLDNYLSQHWGYEVLTPEERVEKLKSIPDYPYNAQVSSKSTSKFEKFFGLYQFQVSYYGPNFRRSDRKDYPYTGYYSSVDTCGLKFETFSEPLTQDAYEHRISAIKRFGADRIND